MQARDWRRLSFMAMVDVTRDVFVPEVDHSDFLQLNIKTRTEVLPNVFQMGLLAKHFTLFYLKDFDHQVSAAWSPLLTCIPEISIPGKLSPCKKLKKHYLSVLELLTLRWWLPGQSRIWNWTLESYNWVKEEENKTIKDGDISP